MGKHHHVLLNKIQKQFEQDERFIALILCGSLAKGSEREDSDIDFYLVCTEEEYNEVVKENRYYVGNTGIFQDEPIEMDGKIVSMELLERAVLKGDEPLRESFRDGQILFDHSGRVASLIDRILEYPENQRETKMRKFFSLFQCSHYYALQALEQDNVYLLMRCLSDCIFYASRVVLSYNRIFFPCHKSLFQALEKAKDLPKDFIPQCKKLMSEPSEKGLNLFFERMDQFMAPLQMTEEEMVGWILQDERTWFTKDSPVAYL